MDSGAKNPSIEILMPDEPGSDARLLARAWRPAWSLVLRAVAAIVSIALLYAVTMYGLWRMPSTLWGMYANTDGDWAAWHARTTVRWGLPFDLSAFNPFAGTGSLFLPNLPWVNPAAMALALPGPVEVGYAVSYTIYFFELLLANYLIYRELGASRWTAFLGAQAFVLILFPPSAVIFNGLPWYSLAPVNAHLLFLCNLALIAALRIGRRHTWPTTIVLTLALFGLCLTAFLTAPITVFTYVPVYALLFCFIVLGCPPLGRETALKLGAFVVIAVTFWLLGIFNYISLTGALSARFVDFPSFLHRGWEYFTWAYWSGAILSKYSVCTYPKYFYLACIRAPMGWILIAGIAGSTITVVKRTPLRAAGLFVIVYTAFMHLFDISSRDLIFGRLHTLQPAFAIWPFFPFCILMAVAGAATIARDVLASFTPALTFSAGTAAAFIAPVAALAGWMLVVGPNQPPLSTQNLGFLGIPKSNLRATPHDPITVRLRAEAAIMPGSEFKGYTATYFGDPRGWLAKEFKMPLRSRGINFYPEVRLPLQRMFGTTFQDTDLWQEGIPSLEEYGQWLTIFMWKLGLGLFTPPDMKLHPTFLRVHKLDIPALRLLGVRFLITDVSLDDDTTLNLMETDTSPSAPGAIMLYRIDGPKIGAESIERVEVVFDFNDALRRIPSLTPGTVVAFEPVLAPLAPAQDVKFHYRRDGFKLTAQANGPSGVVLPIQFSNCLKIETQNGGASAKLLRANAVQTLVLFDGKIDIRVRFAFGPFDLSCRKRDLEDIRRLGIEDAARGKTRL